MNCALIASDMVRNIRDRFKPAVDGGIHLSPEQVDALVSNLNSAYELLCEAAADLDILERRLRAANARRVPIAAPCTDNVVSLPIRNRAPFAGGNDGGDAA